MKKLLTVTCLAGLLSIPSVVFAAEAEPEEVISDEIMAAEAEPEEVISDEIMAAEAVPEEVISDEIMSAEAVPVEPELSPEMQGHIGTSHSGPVLYGTIRGGVQSVSGGATSVTNISSRWGIKGSSEVAEGLNAVYNFEQGFGSATALQNSARLSYIGLSGSFGSLTIGRLNSASNNTVGKITNKSFARSGGGGGITGKLGSAVSYALDVSGVHLQADVVMDGTTTADIDHVEFGISVPVGDIGKIAFAHVRTEGYSEQVPLTTPEFTGKLTLPDIVIPSQTGSVVTKTEFTAKLSDYNMKDFSLPVIKANVDKSKLTYSYKPEDATKATKAFTVLPRTIYGTEEKDFTTYPKYLDYTLIGENAYITDKCTKTDTDGKTLIVDTAAKCTATTTQYYYNKHEHSATATTPAKTAVYNIVVDDKNTTINVTGEHTTTTSVTTSVKDEDKPVKAEPLDISTTEKMEPKRNPEIRSNHIAAEATLGAVKGYLGWSEEDWDGVKSDTTQFGISGALGESGVSYLLEVEKEEVNTNWGIGIYKTLGGGAFAAFEHSNSANVGTSVAFIGIDF